MVEQELAFLKIDKSSDRREFDSANNSPDPTRSRLDDRDWPSSSLPSGLRELDRLSAAHNGDDPNNRSSATNRVYGKSPSSKKAAENVLSDLDKAVVSRSNSKKAIEEQLTKVSPN